ncbi:MAG TPA: DUF1932 domain-containing protein [Acidimicrobiales bacterium]|nr:DUF1932 domain-containing protein [Acidimicrobiales bacterium]
MSASQTVGLVGAGAMGAGIGGALVSAGWRVVSVLGDRSAASRARAAAMGIESVDDLVSLVTQSSIVLSIVPPEVATEVAESIVSAVEEADGAKVFVECNAISPGRARQIAALVGGARIAYIDGGLIGAPPSPGRATALYLSGEGGEHIAKELATPTIRTGWLGPQPALASALKMAYAGWTKGLNALVLSVRALARAEGVEEALLDEWRRSQPGALAASERAPLTADKAWRWIAEMQEIAASLDEAGLPDGSFVAAAELYRRLSGYKDAAAAPVTDEMVDLLLA